MNQYSIIKQKVFEKIDYLSNHTCPFYLITLQYGFYDDRGFLIGLDELRKYWDKTEVQKTIRLVRNLLREHFGISGFYAFTERHKGEYDQYGNEIKKGRFHNHIITTCIDDNVISSPNRKVRKLIAGSDQLSQSFSGSSMNTLDTSKVQLLETCIRKAEWVNRYSHSIKTLIIPTRADLKTVVDYCLKDYNPKTGLDFTDIIDFENSDFYLP